MFFVFRSLCRAEQRAFDVAPYNFGLGLGIGTTSQLQPHSRDGGISEDF